MNAPVDINTRRARDARLGAAIGQTGYQILLAVAGLAATGAVVLGFFAGIRFTFLLAAPAIAC